MGVKGLFKIIAEQAPESMEAVSESTPLTSGESLAIDTTYVIHRYIHADPHRRDLARDIVRKITGLVRPAPATTFVFGGPTQGLRRPALGPAVTYGVRPSRPSSPRPVQSCVKGRRPRTLHGSSSSYRRSNGAASTPPTRRLRGCARASRH